MAEANQASPQVASGRRGKRRRSAIERLLDENMAFMRDTVKSHCRRGHALSDDNLRIGPNGQRICRACNAENQRAFRIRQAAIKRSSR